LIEKLIISLSIMREVDKKLCVYAYVAILNKKGGAKRRLFVFYKGLNPLC
jgi:hypothetical protein